MPPSPSAWQPPLLPLPFVTQRRAWLPVLPASPVLLPQQLLSQLPEPARPLALASAQPHEQPVRNTPTHI